MKKYIKMILFLNAMLATTIVLAFPSEPDPNQDPPATIENYAFVLIALGIGFAYWNTSKKSTNIL